MLFRQFLRRTLGARCIFREAICGKRLGADIDMATIYSVRSACATLSTGLAPAQKAVMKGGLGANLGVRPAYATFSLSFVALQFRVFVRCTKCWRTKQRPKHVVFIFRAGRPQFERTPGVRSFCLLGGHEAVMTFINW